jgi:alpha-beta hydrolase superfamily lysophospholipase
MSTNHKEEFIPSSDGVHSLHAEFFEPTEKNLKICVQISHGMIDFVGRYKEYAESLNELGITVADADHLGHGGSIKSPDERGYFAKRGGIDFLLSDLKTVNDEIRKRYEGYKVVLLGHSMGSFLARLYCERYGDSVDGVILQGTSGPNPLLPFGRALVSLMKPIFGDKHRSAFVKGMADGSYNNKFKGETIDGVPNVGAWLTRDADKVKCRPFDERTNYIFTISGYGDLFKMLTDCNKKSHYKAFPKELPVFLMSGADDPVGSFGKGVKTVYDTLLRAGVKRVEMKLYEGARHELFNELCYGEVVEDTVGFLKSL